MHLSLALRMIPNLYGIVPINLWEYPLFFALLMQNSIREGPPLKACVYNEPSGEYPNTPKRLVVL